jgi:hypothetical protein
MCKCATTLNTTRIKIETGQNQRDVLEVEGDQVKEGRTVTASGRKVKRWWRGGLEVADGCAS